MTRALAGPSLPLDAAARAFFEPRFGTDLGGVRLHTDAGAADAAEAVHARAFTVGTHIAFGGAEYQPASAAGRRLLAHELAHVLQQRTAPAVPSIQRAGGPLDQQLDQAFAQWSEAADEFDARGQHADAAYASRVVLMLQGVDGDTFADADALDQFLSDVEYAALDEFDTVDQTGEWALDFTRAFPLIWSGRVWDALHVDADTAALEEARLRARDAMTTAADRVPGEVADVGLPVPFDEARALASFHLALRHVSLERPHVVRDVALAARAYALAGWQAGFYVAWNAMADSFATRVADGELVVNVADYTDFVEARRAGLEALAARLGAVDVEQMLADFDADVLTLTQAAFVAGFAAMLIGIIPAMILWNEAVSRFDDKMLEVDALVAADDDETRMLRAFMWAHESGYFGAAAAQIWNAILSQGWKILGMAAVFIALQYVPVVNVVLDVVLLLYAGVDAVSAIYALYETFAAVAAARTAVSLQRESARMAASIEGDGLRLLLDVIAVASSVRGIKTKMDRLRAGGLSEEEALRRALAEATGEEAAALRAAAARQRITARFDPDGLLNAVLDSGVNPEVVEQALMSGLSPQRLTTLVAGITDASRAQAIIAYAGSYASPLNALLDAGLPAARIGEMAELGLGLRQLSALDAVLARTGQMAEVEGLLAVLGELGPDAATALARLTSDGLASVYLAGGRGAMDAILETLAFETGGLITGFGDWVEFTIVRMNKQGVDLLNAIGELREAQRIARTLRPGEVVRIGGDLRTGGTSFDLVVEDAAGRVLRNVEVTTSVGRLESYRQLTTGIKHAVSKAPSAAGGVREATIRVTISPRFSLGAGRVRVTNPDATYYIVEADGSIYTRGDILADTARNLPSISGAGDLGRVNIVNMDGSGIGAVVKSNAGTWEVVR